MSQHHSVLSVTKCGKFYEVYHGYAEVSMTTHNAKKNKLGDFKAVKPFLMDDPPEKLHYLQIAIQNKTAQRPSTDSAPSGPVPTPLLL